ncbi:glycine zipper 2TM domain-containing protein [Robbsia sp. Bb-Pol-6]|uniref:Glycine zipper 2TM domain-containing protein n=1 Tax=Robbsia betulipollinis TaxID=2981849 RepID=A0ABT3ZN65_9BURK|nr:glycine zipper 2TM domain-containing protein [Robbsia betulipollinis]MCY0387862.1 glycine zipper 2TM domain-containing protein [Robbsia betulipollinis]
MEPVKSNGNGRSRIHPLMAGAAGAVIVACGVGVAAMTGILPHAGAQNSPPPVAAPAPLAAVPLAPTPVAPAAAPAPMQLAQNEAPRPDYRPAPPPPPRPAFCHTCGVVTSVSQYKTEGHGTGLGAAGGAIAGGLVGHSFGGGNGRTATTILGALGGGLAGNSVERHVRSTTSFRVNVRMEDGTYHSFNYANPPPVSQGERVHIVHGALRAG